MPRGFPGLPMGISSSLALDGVGNSSCGENRGDRVKYWKIIADNLSKAGWSLGRVSGVASRGRTIWIADAHRGDGKRFIMRADEKLTAFMELESAIRGSPSFTHPCTVKRHSGGTENVGLKSHRPTTRTLPLFENGFETGGGHSPTRVLGPFRTRNQLNQLSGEKRKETKKYESTD
jgi:hypothetical protein